jgi:hypothetical protein
MKMTTKRLKVLIPAVQVILLVSATVWHNVAWHNYDYAQHDTALRSAGIPLGILAKLNFPLLVLWFPVFLFLEWACSASYLSLPSGVALVAVAVVFGVAILTSVGLFWRFVVSEVEMRRHGNSFIRSSSRIIEGVKAVLFAGTGIGGVAYAYWDGHRLQLLGRGRTGAIIGGLFLVVWSLVLIDIAVQDLMVAARKK